MDLNVNRFRRRWGLTALFLALCTRGIAQTGDGAVAGFIIEQGSSRPVEYAAVVVKNKADGKTVRSGATDAKGAFDLSGLPFGSYDLTYGLVGAETPERTSFTIDAQHQKVSLGRLSLGAENSAVKMDKVEVGARKEAFYNSIDRKTYNVGKDIQSVSGSASDLLANVPSVQVDIEGNVSLRGDANVLILVNGKTSTMMGRNRAAVLEQMPADGIEKIEVITNPSAKYKPDGTGGIINITLKKKQEPGYSGGVRASVGNNERYNAGVTANFNLGKYNIHGSASVRQDDRPRSVHDERSHPDATNTTVATTQVTTEKARPLSRIAQAGVDYKVDDQTKIGADLRYNYRDFVRHSTVSSLTRTGGLVTKDYDRTRTDPEYEKDLEFTGTLQHAFAKEDEELSFELRHGKTTEQEDNHYANIYRGPAATPTSLDNTLIKNTETNTESTADYANPFGENAKLELGYNGQWNKVDLDFRGSFFDAATQAWQTDTLRTNRFIYDAAIHAFYGTYAQKLGKFGALAGLRFEQATIHTDQVTAHLKDKNDYSRLYPSLHLSYNLSEVHQLQLNYSHRVHRPEGDDLNPFPEFDDPANVRAGNPHLRPEEIHSIEGGYQYRNNDTTYLATLYYKYRYNGMTEVRRFVDSATLLPNPSGATLLTTRENLGTSRSGGLELGATTRVKDRLSLNFSGNVYRSEIDASNLGFSAKRSTIAWDAKLNANFDVSKTTLVQLNTNYRAKQLTPQGYRYPTFFANVGLRHNLKDKKTAFILSVSDIFNSQKERTLVDTPALHQEITRRRSSRILYAGFIYNFGKATKKSKEDLQFDNSL
jgi:outer membrane receptor protein involved in Fe transport